MCLHVRMHRVYWSLIYTESLQCVQHCRKKNIKLSSSFIGYKFLEGRDEVGLHFQPSHSEPDPMMGSWGTGKMRPIGSYQCYNKKKNKGCGCQSSSITQPSKKGKASENRWHLSGVLKNKQESIWGIGREERPFQGFYLPTIYMIAITIMIMIIIIPTLSNLPCANLGI